MVWASSAGQGGASTGSVWVAGTAAKDKAVITINGDLSLAAAWNFPAVLQMQWSVRDLRLPAVHRNERPSHSSPTTRRARPSPGTGSESAKQGGRQYRETGLQREAPTQDRGNMHRALHRARRHRSSWQCASSVTGDCRVHTRGQPSTDRACIPPLGNRQTFLVWLGHPAVKRTTGRNGTVYHARATTPCRPRPDAEVGSTSGDCARIMKDCLLVRRPHPLLPTVSPNPSRFGIDGGRFRHRPASQP